MDIRATGLYVVAATALLGSPGPGIAALLATGRSQGWSRSLPFLLGLLTGLAIALVASGAGLASIMAAYPRITQALTILATIYLLYLAYAIATSPASAEDKRPPTSAGAGLLLGLTNPKAYLAFASLLASPLNLVANAAGNVVAKVTVTMLVIVSVDLIWLRIGVTIGRSRIAERSARALNVAMGSMVAIAALLMFA